jgi:response regulator RpfG family c-di-GMP phosphodiesterase/tRNA A-37 threonylcarbamoyl transferase component Bud32
MNSLPRTDARSDSRKLPALAIDPRPTPRPIPAWALAFRQTPPHLLNFLDDQVRIGLLTVSEVTEFLGKIAHKLNADFTPDQLGAMMVADNLLTSYQLKQILAGKGPSLVLGNYRLRDQLGGGSVGTVFVGEHILLQRRVAVKTMASDEMPLDILNRFTAEMRALADLRHPHVVMAYDAGVLPARDRTTVAQHYLVMELVDGGDLEQYVYANGVLPVAQGCEWIRQAATGLHAAHDQHLIHRDVKPSNLLLTRDRQVKLVDFGLAREYCSSKTDPQSLVGSVEFMAPEQSLDPTAVTVAADIYGLGATLFWLLTGQTVLPQTQTLAEALMLIKTHRPRRLRDFLPDVPPELDAMVSRILDRDPDRRPPTALAVAHALGRFAAPAAAPGAIGPLDPASEAVLDPFGTGADGDQTWNVVIADRDPVARRMISTALDAVGCVCHVTGAGQSVIDLAREKSIDLVLMDRDLEGANGYDVCHWLREHPPKPYLKVVITANASADEVTVALARGADDFIIRPYTIPQLAARVRAALRLKAAQDRAAQLANDLIETNRQLARSLDARSADVRKAQDALLFAMAKMAELREGETTGHLRRMQRYVVCLAEHLRTDSAWSMLIDRTFIEHLERCTPLHDIGKVGLPDHILLKEGTWSADERRLMEAHTTIGVDLLEAIGKEFGGGLAFMGMARAVVKHHHERYDGRGYPDRLAADAIPPAARLVAVADAYDGIRRPRRHRAPLPHAQAARILLNESPGQFDPVVLRAFAARNIEFQQIFDSIVS